MVVHACALPPAGTSGQRCRGGFYMQADPRPLWRLTAPSASRCPFKRTGHSEATAMRSSACVVMATKAVAALLRNKMAGVVSLSLPPSSPFLSPFLFGISEVEQIGCDAQPPSQPRPTHHHPPVTSRPALSLPSLFCPFIHIWESAGAAALATL